MPTTKLDSFTTAYLVACLWSSNDESTPEGGEPFDHNYGIEDFADEALAQAMADCAKFQADHGDLLNSENCNYGGCPVLEYAGHDFWLTRAGHGCGFWDGNWIEPAATALTATAKAFGDVNPYLGDDGKIYFT